MLLAKGCSRLLFTCESKRLLLSVRPQNPDCRYSSKRLLKHKFFRKARDSSFVKSALLDKYASDLRSLFHMQTAFVIWLCWFPDQVKFESRLPDAYFDVQLSIGDRCPDFTVVRVFFYRWNLHPYIKFYLRFETYLTYRRILQGTNWNRWILIATWGRLLFVTNGACLPNTLKLVAHILIAILGAQK